MKEKWTEPKTTIEEFIPNEYIAACVDNGQYEILPNAIPDSNDTKYCIDMNRNQQLDADEMRNGVQVTTSASAYDKLDKENATSYWGWRVVNGEPSNNMLRLFDTGNGSIFVAFERKWVSNKNNS